LSLSIANNNFANLSAQAGLYQGTAAIASWLSGLAANNSTQGGTPSASTASAAPNVSSGPSATYTQFRSQVSAATTAATSDSTQADDSSASNYQQVAAAYGDS
jgi:hypothetical protein